MINLEFVKIIDIAHNQLSIQQKFQFPSPCGFHQADVASIVDENVGRPKLMKTQKQNKNLQTV